MAVTFALGSVWVGLLAFTEFLRDVPGWWSERSTMEGSAMILAALLCSVLPYGLVLWNLRRGPSREKGLFQALTIGSFWFLLGTLLLVGMVFDQLAKPSSEMRGTSSDMFEVAIVTGVFFTLPGLLFLTSALKASRSLSAGIVASAKAGQPSGPLLDRIGLGGTLTLFSLAGILSPFAVGPALGWLRSALFEALLLCGLLPYAFVFQRLRRHGADQEVLTFGSSLAIGCLTCCILGAGVWGYITSTERRHHHSPYRWAELAFFALLALLNVLMLRNTLRLKRSSATLPFEPLSWLSILAIPVSLVTFIFVLFLYSLSV
jgi:hypothetical protein